jgi:hypothetical protein
MTPSNVSPVEHAVHLAIRQRAELIHNRRAELRIYRANCLQLFGLHARPSRPRVIAESEGPDAGSPNGFAAERRWRKPALNHRSPRDVGFRDRLMSVASAPAEKVGVNENDSTRTADPGNARGETLSQLGSQRRIAQGHVPPCHSMRSSLLTRRWSEPDSNSRSRCDGQRYGVRSLKRRLDRRGMTSGAARNGLRFQLVLLRKPFHASDGPFWSGGLRRAVP